MAVRGDLSALLSNKKLNDCEGWLESIKLRTVCIEQVAPLRSELAKAERREKLEAGLPTSAKPQAEKQADPGSAAQSPTLPPWGSQSLPMWSRSG